jgi:sulfur-oxidizing protein SoxY
MMIRLLFLTLLVTVFTVQAEESDPIGSPMWDYTREQFIGAAPYRFDDRVKVSLPAFTENSAQVPVHIDASALAGDIERIVVWADLNPIQHIFTYYPHPDVIPKVSQGSAEHCRQGDCALSFGCVAYTQCFASL